MASRKDNAHPAHSVKPRHRSKKRQRGAPPIANPHIPTSADTEIRDQLALVCDVVLTVVNSLNDHNSLPAAMTLMHYGLEPLIKIKDELSPGGDELDADDL